MDVVEADLVKGKRYENLHCTFTADLVLVGK